METEGLRFVIAYQSVSREDFYKSSSKIIANLLERTKTDEVWAKKIDNTKIYIMGKVSGKDVYSIFFVEKDSKLYQLLERHPSKFDVIKDAEI